MKYFLLLQMIFYSAAVMSQCQAPGQGFMEKRFKDVFRVEDGEAELREWVSYPKNHELREEIKSLDRRTKFVGRWEKEELLNQSKEKFDLMIHNTGRPSEFSDFPVAGSLSKVESSKGSINIEMTGLAKDELDFLDKEILDKLSPKVKVKYFYPYDKFEYAITYDGVEQPMEKGLGKIQQDMEKRCELRVIENKEYRQWYDHKLKNLGVPPEPSRPFSGNKSSRQ